MTASTRSNAGAIWALGVTQIIGYRTLYYSFSILAPGIAKEFAVAVEWIYVSIFPIEYRQRLGVAA